MISAGIMLIDSLKSLSANFTKWSNTFKQFVGKLPTNCLSMFDHFVGLALKGLKSFDIKLGEKMFLIFLIQSHYRQS